MLPSSIVFTTMEHYSIKLSLNDCHLNACRCCFVKFCDSNSVSVAQHLTNTVFIDRAIIVTPLQSGDVPDERDGLIMATQVPEPLAPQKASAGFTCFAGVFLR